MVRDYTARPAVHSIDFVGDIPCIQEIHQPTLLVPREVLRHPVQTLITVLCVKVMKQTRDRIQNGDSGVASAWDHSACSCSLKKAEQKRPRYVAILWSAGISVLANKPTPSQTVEGLTATNGLSSQACASCACGM